MLGHLADAARPEFRHAAAVDVLNIRVPASLAAQWRAWLAPRRQPFFLTAGEEERLGFPCLPRAEAAWTEVERDTFTVWRITQDADRVAWLTWNDWDALSPSVQRELLRLQVRHGRGNVPLGRHYADLLPGLPAERLLWRPEHLTPEVLARIVAADGQACQRAQVPQRVWEQAAPVLPRVRELAGTFSDGVGNCFGAVMGAAGLPDAENQWVVREPFEDFLQERAVPGGRYDAPGTLLVWRSADGLVQHAAVTLGGGWAFEKPAQTWSTPRVVLPVHELIKGNRSPGLRLTRSTLL
ncbi:hypothetical protein [Deinococcus cavernae]|uniref:hypothetical protein n=1 Tax=Deinococcus cavernae TaxID=2320857 RepID=UPI001F22C2BA|nr:hypothetical protein [Deinococcus cavernae]